jgi:hypothetical protein
MVIQKECACEESDKIGTDQVLYRRPPLLSAFLFTDLILSDFKTANNEEKLLV